MNIATHQPETQAMITPSEVIEYLYCPRFVYFMHCLNIPQHEDRRFKVLKGREVHQRRETENKDYLRKKIGVTKKEIGVYLASPSLKVRGIVDEVLTLEDGTM
ncbi:MAG: CRISPR-associated protein Cas4, partial [Candidatus Binatia bacterium]